MMKLSTLLSVISHLERIDRIVTTRILEQNTLCRSSETACLRGPQDKNLRQKPQKVPKSYSRTTGSV